MRKLALAESDEAGKLMGWKRVPPTTSQRDWGPDDTKTIQVPLSKGAVEKPPALLLPSSSEPAAGAAAAGWLGRGSGSAEGGELLLGAGRAAVRTLDGVRPFPQN